MNAFQFCQVLKAKNALPLSTERPCEPTSNSELRRWFEKNSIIIDGSPISINQEIQFPINEVVFHPKGKKKCTMGGFHWCEIDICNKCSEILNE
jgi:hypothetical protein